MVLMNVSDATRIVKEILGASPDPACGERTYKIRTLMVCGTFCKSSNNESLYFASTSATA